MIIEYACMLQLLPHFHQARDVMMMYLKSREFPKTSDPAEIMVPATDPIYKVLYQSSSATTSSSRDISCIGVDTNFLEIDPNNINTKDDSAYDATGSREALDDDEVLVTGDANSLFDVRSDPWNKAYQLHIHKDGLIPVEDVSIAMGAGSSFDQHSSVPQVTTISKISGSSSIGGWGIDAGTVWKPISLPPSGNTSTTKDVSSKKHKSTKKSGSSSNNKHETVEDASTELVMRKEDFFKSILKKMSPYFAIVGQKGIYYYLVCHLYRIAMTFSVK